MEHITQTELDAATQLLRALEQEYAALSGNDLPALEAATQSKHECVAKLESIAQHLPNHGTLAMTVPRHCEFKDLIERCQQLNILNGKLIALRRSSTERAMHILRGDAEDASSYNSTGRAQAAATRILGKV